MIFLDSSALLKRYVREVGTEDLLALMTQDPVWSACSLAAVETAIGLCRRSPSIALREAANHELDADWGQFIVVSMDDAVLRRATDIGCRLGMRTLDSIHLAAAEQLPGALTFVTFDQRQASAARELGLVVAP